MNTNFAVIGGDLRMIELAKLLAKEENKVYTYGLEKVEELRNRKNVILCENIKGAIQNAKMIIAPIPLSSDGKKVKAPFSKNTIEIQELIANSQNKKIIAGSIQLEVKELAKQNQAEMIDLMEKEELAVLNAISTAEGAIELVMGHTNKTIHGSKILILGFGRIGKVLAKKLEGLSADVTCAVRKEEDKAWLEAYGYKSIDINTLGKNLAQYDSIINTVPHLILTTEKLQYVDKETLLLDLASKPGGMETKTVEQMKLKFIWGLALPGKVAPATTAKYIKRVINQMVKE